MRLGVTFWLLALSACWLSVSGSGARATGGGTTLVGLLTGRAVNGAAVLAVTGTDVRTLARYHASPGCAFGPPLLSPDGKRIALEVSCATGQGTRSLQVAVATIGRPLRLLSLPAKTQVNRWVGTNALELLFDYGGPDGRFGLLTQLQAATPSVSFLSTAFRFQGREGTVLFSDDRRYAFGFVNRVRGTSAAASRLAGPRPRWRPLAVPKLVGVGVIGLGDQDRLLVTSSAAGTPITVWALPTDGSPAHQVARFPRLPGRSGFPVFSTNAQQELVATNLGAGAVEFRASPDSAPLVLASSNPSGLLTTPVRLP